MHGPAVDMVRVSRRPPPGLKPIEVVVADVLSRVEERRLSLRAVMEDYFSKRRRMAPIRGVVRAYCLGVLRNYRLLDFAVSYCHGVDVEKLGAFKRNLLRALAYEVAFRGVSVERAREVAKKFLKGVRVSLRGWRELAELDPERITGGLRDIERLAVLYSQPTWVVRYLVRLLGRDEAVKLLESFNQPKPLWVRVNTLKVSRRELAERLRERGYEVVEDKDLPDLLRVEGSAEGLSRLPEHEAGLFYIQDKASALVAHVLGAEEGAVVLDMCAAPGGKATHVYAMGRGRVEVVALEVKRGRVRALEAVSKRLSCWLDAVLADSRHPPLRLRFRYVLLDPDCSSLGKLGHSPEIRLWIKREVVRRYSRLQRDLLKAASQLVESGGVLVYSTCTLTVEENEENMLWALEELGFSPAEVNAPLGVPGLRGLRWARRLYPHLHDTVGFFLAKLTS